MPDPVQGERDDGRGPGGDLAGRDGGSELRVHGRDGPAGESLPGQQRVGQASRRLASAALIRSRARRNSTVFRYPSSSTDSGTAGSPVPGLPAGAAATDVPEGTKDKDVPEGAAATDLPAGAEAKEAPAGSAVPGAPVCHPPGLSRQPVVHPVTAPVTAPVAAAADCFLVRSTAAAATSCRYSTARETSSTLPAKSDAARKPHDPASSTAVEPTARSAARAASIPDCPTGAAPRSVPCASSPQAVKSLMKSLTASMARVYLRAPTKVMGTVPPRNDSGTAHSAEPQTNCDHAPRWVRGHSCAPKTAARG